MIDIGWLIGTIITALIVLVLVAGIGWWWFGEDEPRARLVGTGFGLALVVVTVGIYVWAAFPPFSMDYHTYRQVSGTVAAIDVRMLAAEKGTTQNYAVRLDDGGTYRCDDTRCALVHPGDQLTLSCVKVWEYASTPGYACRFIEHRPKVAT